MIHRSLFAALFLGATALTATACSHAEDGGASDVQDTSASTAKASKASAADDESRPPVLAQLESQGLEIVDEFPAGDGLRGFAAVGGQKPMAVYVTAKGDAIVGVRIGADGKEVDAEHLKDLVARPMTDRAWKQLEASTWVRDGRANAPRVIYLFTDPNCPYCHQLWQAARPWVDSGKVQLRHVMVGVIREDSANKVATILEASDPGAALEKNELNYDKGGITPAPTVSANVRSTLDANQLLMVELGFRGTPGIVFKDDAGLMQQRSGLPRGDDLDTVFGPR